MGNEYAYSPVDNWKNFYRTGINNTTTLAVSGASDKISYRFGVSNMAVKGILPNSSISQQGINMNTTYDISSKVHLMVNANYVFDKNKGRSNLSDGNSNTRPHFFIMPIHLISVGWNVKIRIVTGVPVLTAKSC